MKLSPPPPPGGAVAWGEGHNGHGSLYAAPSRLELWTGEDLRRVLGEVDLLLWSGCFGLLALSEGNTPVEADENH